MAEKICRKLKTSREVLDNVVWLVDNHMRFHKIPEMRRSKCTRLFEHPLFCELAELGRADRLGALRDDDNEYRHAMEMYEAHYQDNSAAGVLLEPLVRGGDIIKLGVPQGPLIGLILGELDDARREGDVANRDQALAFAESLVGELRKTRRL